MKQFRTTLVAGAKPPYSSWTFLVLPEELVDAWGAGPKAVRGRISGEPFRGTASRGEGVLRVPVPRTLRDRLGVRAGDVVEVEIELDTEPRPLALPAELGTVLRDDPELAGLYDRLPASLRRAWATYIGGAKRPQTRQRRAARAPAGIRAREYPG